MKTRQEIITHAKSLIGYTKYLIGAKWHNYNNDSIKPKLLDCSGFVVWAYKMAGFSIPDGTYHQWQASHEISKNELQIGDIGIMGQGGIGTFNHIGIYAGDEKWIHCNYSRNGVTLEKTNIFKYYRRFNNLVFEDNKPQPPKPSVKIKDDNKTSSSKPNARMQDNKGDDEMIEQKEFLVNNKKTKLDTIFKENKNYVSLQSLKEAGIINASYDKENKIAIITSK